MEWNAESVLDALNDFERKSEIPEILDQYLERIAKNGEIVFPWNKLKPLLKKKLEFVLDEFYETCPVETSVPVPNFETFNFDNLKKTILQAVDAFTSAPFTIQRLCELVTNPTKHYNRTDKYMRGIEKNVLVVSTIEPRSEQGGDNANNPVVNGMPNDSPRDDNDTNGHETPDSVSSSNLNTPSNHVLLENFANVFPSAVCIPPSTDISVDSDVDNNFMENPEQELAPVERIEGTVAPLKDEEMDTQEDEQSEKEQDMAEESPNTTDSENLSDDPLEPALVEVVATVENTPNEAICSVETDAIPENTESKPVESQQDDTVSQSDDNSQTSSEEPTEVPEENIEVADYINEDVINKLDDYINKVGDVISGDDVPLQVDAPTEVATDVDVPESISTTEVSENCMDSESSTSSNEPDVPV